MRFKNYLQKLGYWSDVEEDNYRKSIKKEILKAFAQAENKPKAHWKELFTDVYKDVPHHIK